MTPETRERSATLRALFEVLVCSGFPTQLLLTVLLIGWGLPPRLTNGQLSGAYVYTLSLLDAMLLLLLITAFILADGDRPIPFFLGSRPVLGEVLYGIVLIPVVFLLVVTVLLAIQLFAPWLHNLSKNPLEDLVRTPIDALLFGSVAVLAGGVREELQRAFVLRRFERHLGGARVGLILFSLLFGSGHVVQGWDVAVTTTLLGLFWGTVFLRRRNVVAPIVSHAGFNATEIAQFYLFGR